MKNEREEVRAELIRAGVDEDEITDDAVDNILALAGYQDLNCRRDVMLADLLVSAMRAVASQRDKAEQRVRELQEENFALLERANVAEESARNAEAKRADAWDEGLAAGDDRYEDGFPMDSNPYRRQP